MSYSSVEALRQSPDFPPSHHRREGGFELRREGSSRVVQCTSPITLPRVTSPNLTGDVKELSADSRAAVFYWDQPTTSTKGAQCEFH